MCFLASSRWQPNCIEFLYMETRLKPPLSKYFYLTTMKTSTFVNVHTNNEHELNVPREKNSVSLREKTHSTTNVNMLGENKMLWMSTQNIVTWKDVHNSIPSLEQNSHNSDSKTRGFLAFQTCNINSLLVRMRLIFYFVNGHSILAFIAWPTSTLMTCASTYMVHQSRTQASFLQRTIKSIQNLASIVIAQVQFSKDFSFFIAASMKPLGHKTWPFMPLSMCGLFRDIHELWCGTDSHSTSCVCPCKLTSLAASSWP